MTRKIIIVFLVLLLCFYSLISSILGERGFLANNQLKRQLKANEYELDRKAVELENLKIQEKELSTEDGIRSAAMNLGYQVDTDNVYVFQTEDMPSGPNMAVSTNKQMMDNDAFKPWASSFILLISFCASSIISLILLLFRKVKVDADDSEQDESRDFGNNFNAD